MTQFAAESFTGLTSGQTLQSQSANFLKHPTAAAEFFVSSPNTVFNNNTTTSICRHITSPPSADYSVSCDLVFKTLLSAQYNGVAFRMDATANTMYFGRYSGTAGWQLYKSIAGTATQLGSSVAESFSSGTKNLKVVGQGTTISLYNEGEATPVISVTDTSITAAGYAGIRSGGGGAIATNGIHITNFSADTLDGGETSLTANSISSGVPTAGQPSITQGHALTANSITAGVPTLGQPEIPTESNHSLTAVDIVSGVPTVGIPALTAITGILGADIPSTGEHGGSPVPNDFSINPASRYSWEVITQPSAGVLEIFSDLTFTWDAFGVADGDYTWVYRLYENGVSVGTATVYMHVGALAVENITSGIPTLGTPALTENDAGALLPENIVAGSPVLGSPALTQNNALSGGAIAAGAPVFGTPTLAQQHAMMAIGIVAGTPALGTPALTPTVPGSLSLTQEDIDAIAAAVVAALQATTIPANIKAVNDKLITGSGVTGDSMRPV